jgi:hypothetical protein
MILRLKISKDRFHRAAIDLGRDPVEAIVPHIIRTGCRPKTAHTFRHHVLVSLGTG